MPLPELHELVRVGDCAKVETYLEQLGGRREGDINAYDSVGYTPLVRAVIGPHGSVEMTRLLLAHGANPHLGRRKADSPETSVLALAAGDGDPEKVRLLLRHGADVRWSDEHGYDVLVYAVYHRDVFHDSRLLDLLSLLIAAGADLNGVTSHRESALRVLSRLGRFDAVRLLLDAGADAGQLQWTPLLQAVASGSISEVEAEIGAGASLEDRDWWDRTAWLLAIQTGDIGKARLLQERGADIHARGRCGKLPLFYAIDSDQLPMLGWLLEGGQGVEDRDDFGATPLMEAVQEGNAAAVKMLLHARAEVHASREYEQTALSGAETKEISLMLLHAGANPRHLAPAGRRGLLGLPPRPDQSVLTISPAEFQAGKARRFGTSNPEEFDVPFWQAMIRAGITGYEATKQIEGEVKWRREPVWCADRFGQSITFLADGRIIQVAGEHEDHYDPDFCIYNDVFVHRPDGGIAIFGYPKAVFPPTDFHTATLLGEFIYLIGSLGYPGERRYGITPVYRLHTASWRMEEVFTTGEAPGWIYEHAATNPAPDQIRVSGGKIVTWVEDDESHLENERAFVLQVSTGVWVAA